MNFKSLGQKIGNYRFSKFSLPMNGGKIQAPWCLTVKNFLGCNLKIWPRLLKSIKSRMSKQTFQCHFLYQTFFLDGTSFQNSHQSQQFLFYSNWDFQPVRKMYIILRTGIRPNNFRSHSNHTILTEIKRSSNWRCTILLIIPEKYDSLW